VPSVTRISAIAAGGYHSLVVTGGSVIAWGWNGWGQVGDGTTETRDHPVVIGASGEIVAVAAGTAHSLALGADGRVWSWGLGATGQLGRSAGTWTATSGVVGISGVTAVAAGGYNSLALGPNGTVSSWGWNAFGQLGDGTTTDRSSPVAVPGLVGMVSLAAGVAHGLATAG